MNDELLKKGWKKQNKELMEKHGFCYSASNFVQSHFHFADCPILKPELLYINKWPQTRYVVSSLVAHQSSSTIRTPFIYIINAQW